MFCTYEAKFQAFVFGHFTHGPGYINTQEYCVSISVNINTSLNRSDCVKHRFLKQANSNFTAKNNGLGDNHSLQHPNSLDESLEAGNLLFFTCAWSSKLTFRYCNQNSEVLVLCFMQFTNHN